MKVSQAAFRASMILAGVIACGGGGVDRTVAQTVIVDGQTGQVLAAQAPGAAAAIEEDKAILPYISEATFLVARLDVERVDAKLVQDFMQKMTKTVLDGQQPPQEQRARMEADSKQAGEKVKKWLAGMSEAGGKHVYALVDWSNDAGRDRGGPVIVVPIPKGADADKITAALTDDEAFHGASTRHIGDAVVLGDPGQLKRVEDVVQAGGAKAEDRADLAKAFESAGDAPLRVALVPGEPTRSWVEANLPSLPEPLGGGETQILSRGVRYASITITQKPKMLASVAVQCENADKAKALLDVINKGTEFAKQSLANAPEQARTAWAGQLEHLKPTLDGDTIKLTIDPVLIAGKFGLARSGRTAVPAPAPAQPRTPATTGDGGL